MPFQTQLNYAIFETKSGNTAAAKEALDHFRKIDAENEVSPVSSAIFEKKQRCSFQSLKTLADRVERSWSEGTEVPPTDPPPPI